MPERKRHRDKAPARAKVPCNRAEKLFVCVDLWPAEFVAGRRYTHRVLHQPRYSFCDILHMDQLRLRLTAADNGQTGRSRIIFTNVVRKASSEPNMTDGRISVALAKARCTACSPSPRALMYREGD